jgi:hypothetical protein
MEYLGLKTNPLGELRSRGGIFLILFTYSANWLHITRERGICMFLIYFSSKNRVSGIDYLKLGGSCRFLWS